MGGSGRVLPTLLGALLALSGCALGQRQDPPARNAAAARTDHSGGIVRLLSADPIASWDPQRMTSGGDEALTGRLFSRTLTAHAPTGADGHSTLVGDLATDTGTPSADLRSWTFTLREGPTWQDGSPVTCADVQHGVARNFAPDVVGEGGTDALALLDIPRTPEGASRYRGPYRTGGDAAAAERAFTDAVSCRGSKITFNLSSAVADFDAVVSRQAFAPVRAGEGPEAAGTPTVFSNGPYRLQRDWDPDAGAVLVRNPAWRSDTDPVRRAHPDQIRLELAVPETVLARDVIGDTLEGRNAVSLTPVPLALLHQVVARPDVLTRTIHPGTGVIDHLLPNTKSALMSQPQARRALALATDRTAYVTALGGENAALPVHSVIPPGLISVPAESLLGEPLSGDLVRARQELERAGLGTDVKLRVAYRSGDVADRAMAALARGWDDAGFHTILIPVDDYFATVSQPSAAQRYDVFWSSWAPTGDSASSILPSLFDSRINLTASGTGRDLGSWSSPQVEEMMDAVEEQSDRARREREWAALDALLRDQGAYIALAERRALYVAGSGIRNLSAVEATGGHVDLAVLAVAP